MAVKTDTVRARGSDVDWRRVLDRARRDVELEQSQAETRPADECERSLRSLCQQAGRAAWHLLSDNDRPIPDLPSELRTKPVDPERKPYIDPDTHKWVDEVVEDEHFDVWWVAVVRLLANRSGVPVELSEGVADSSLGELTGRATSGSPPSHFPRVRRSEPTGRTTAGHPLT